MTYHYRRGERDQALRTYERCRTALADMLGVAPMPQTREVHERIVQGRPVCDPGQPPSAMRASPQTKKAEPGRPDALPLVGREDELQALEEHLATALAGRGQSVFIAGEAGVGKTRLAGTLLDALDELLATASSANRLKQKMENTPSATTSSGRSSMRD